MIRICGAVAVLGCSVAFAGHGHGADIDPVWLERAKSEGRASRDKYAALVKQLEETNETRKEYDAPTKDPHYKPMTVRFRAAALDGSRLFERFVVNEDGTTTAQLDCANEVYQFQLRRNDPTKAYALTKYMPIKPGDMIHVSGAFSTAAYTELSRLLAAIDGSKQSTLKALRWDEGRQLLYLRMDYNGSPPPSVYLIDLEAWLDVANHWRSVEARAKTARQISHTTYTYGPPIDGLAFPAVTVATAAPQGNNTEPPHHIRATLTVRKSTASPADFRLAAFGLPEPVDVPPVRRTPTYLWLLLAAVACVALAAGFRFLARRHRVRTAV